MQSEKPNPETTQGDLFGTPLSAAQLREESRFGTWDAKCGLPLRNYYSERIAGERLAAYETAYREERTNARRQSEYDRI